MRSIGLVLGVVGIFLLYLVVRGKAPDAMNALFNTEAFTDVGDIKTLPNGQDVGKFNGEDVIINEPSLWDRITKSTLNPGSDSYVFPSTSKTISSFFGNRDIGTGSKDHKGIDIAGSGIANSPVLAIQDGTVVKAGAATGYGEAIYIQHANGLISKYGHLSSSMNVKVGDTVKAGQQIGTVGAGIVGTSTGSHLHFQVERGGIAIDPLSIFQNLKGASA